MIKLEFPGLRGAEPNPQLVNDASATTDIWLIKSPPGRCAICPCYSFRNYSEGLKFSECDTLVLVHLVHFKQLTPGKVHPLTAKHLGGKVNSEAA